MLRAVCTKNGYILKWRKYLQSASIKRSDCQPYCNNKIFTVWTFHNSKRLFNNQSNQVKQVCDVILRHFDKQYHEELGQLWLAAREVLLRPECWQYGIMLNRFCALEELRQQLELLGFSSLLHEERDSLQCLVHPSAIRVPSQKHRAGQLKQYYLLNAASLLPVLALEVRQGDRVLDLCSAPGGKALAVLQSATPGLLHCNELDGHRYRRLTKTLESFIPQALSGILSVSNLDGRCFGEMKTGAFDKVLVDAPCSNDRNWLYLGQPEQGALMLGERIRLPKLQKELLRSALETLRPGGVAVYATCTLSRAENSAVVEDVLLSCPHVEVQDLRGMARSFSQHFTFDPSSPSGLLVVPDQGRTWGPMFISKMKRLY